MRAAGPWRRHLLLVADDNTMPTPVASAGIFVDPMGIAPGSFRDIVIAQPTGLCGASSSGWRVIWVFPTTGEQAVVACHISP